MALLGWGVLGVMSDSVGDGAADFMVDLALLLLFEVSDSVGEGAVDLMVDLMLPLPVLGISGFVGSSVLALMFGSTWEAED